MIHEEIHFIDFAIIGIYLVTMVAIGLLVVRKVKNMDDYYLKNVYILGVRTFEHTI